MNSLAWASAETTFLQPPKFQQDTVVFHGVKYRENSVQTAHINVVMVVQHVIQTPIPRDDSNGPTCHQHAQIIEPNRSYCSVMIIDDSGSFCKVLDIRMAVLTLHLGFQIGNFLDLTPAEALNFENVCTIECFEREGCVAYHFIVSTERCVFFTEVIDFEIDSNYKARHFFRFDDTPVINNFEAFTNTTCEIDEQLLSPRFGPIKATTQSNINTYATDSLNIGDCQITCELLADCVGFQLFWDPNVPLMSCKFVRKLAVLSSTVVGGSNREYTCYIRELLQANNVIGTVSLQRNPIFEMSFVLYEESTDFQRSIIHIGTNATSQVELPRLYIGPNSTRPELTFSHVGFQILCDTTTFELDIGRRAKLRVEI